MEGDIITTQDVFLFDFAAGVRRARQVPGPAALDRPAAPLPRAARRPRRPRRPGGLRHRRGAAMRPPLGGAAAPRCVAALVLRSCCRPRPRTRPTRSTSTTSRPTTARSRCCCGVDRLPAGAAADLDSVVVTVDGEPVDATAETVEAGQVERTTVLVLDASNSMAGRRSSRPPRPPSRRSSTAAPADVRIGLVTFAGTVAATRSRRPPTTQSLAGALDGSQLQPGTRRLRRRRCGPSSSPATDGSRSLLVLSDGADTRQRRRRIDDAVRRLPRTPASSSTSSRSASRRAAGDPATDLATATGGQVIPADPTRSARASPPRPTRWPSRCWSPSTCPPGVGGEADRRRLRRQLAARPSPTRPSSAWRRSGRRGPDRRRARQPLRRHAPDAARRRSPSASGSLACSPSCSWAAGRRVAARPAPRRLLRRARRPRRRRHARRGPEPSEPQGLGRRPDRTRWSRATSRPGSPSASPGPGSALTAGGVAAAARGHRGRRRASSGFVLGGGAHGASSACSLGAVAPVARTSSAGTAGGSAPSTPSSPRPSA